MNLLLFRRKGRNMDNERIILGSGYLHLKLFDGKLPTVDEICTEETLFSYISGGATLEYKPESYEAKDDMGKVSKTILVSEEVMLKSGLMTFCGNTLEKLCDTARVSYTEKTGDKKRRRVVKVGGVSNQKGAKYAICFHHEDPVDGDIWVMIVGNNQAGFSLAFAKDKETVVDAEFKAHPMDKEGTLIHYEEDVLEADTAAIAEEK
nr:MAG TPA: hypothetical protein [Caudoviricetes sp.]